MNRFIFPVIIVAVLGYALFSLNGGMSKNARSSDDDESQQQSQQSNSQKPATPPPPSTPAASPAGQSASLSVTPDEVVVGDPSKAKYKIVAGWAYDPANQANSAQLDATVKSLQSMAQSSNGKVSVQIVDVDVPDASRSTATKGIHDLGITVNGKPATSDNLGEGASTPASVTQSIGQMTAH